MEKTRKGLSWKEAANLAGEKNRKEKLKRVKKYDKNPTLCFFCNVPVPYEKRKNKFCGHSCSASFNNLGIRRNFNEFSYNEYLKKKDLRDNYAKRPCLDCGKITINKKFCSRICNSKYDRNQRRKAIEISDTLIDYRRDKWYLIETRGHKCERCSTEQWMNEPIPLDVHHKDGDSDNNKLDNLQLICPNCHRLTPNHGSKNKTNSKRKQYRKKRYDAGLSY